MAICVLLTFKNAHSVIRMQFMSHWPGILPAATTVHSGMSIDSVSPSSNSADDSRSDISNLVSDSEVLPRQKKDHSRKETSRGYSARRPGQSKSIDALRRSPRRKVIT